MGRFWTIVLWLTVICGGCSSQDPQAKFAQQTEKVDCVLLVQESGSPGRSAASLIRGDAVRELLQAVAMATPTEQKLATNHGFAQLFFLEGTSRRAAVLFGRNCFWLEGRGYTGDTGEWADLRASRPLHFLLPDGFKGFVRLVRNAKTSSDTTPEAALSHVKVPEDGVVTTRERALLFGWPATASYQDGRPVEVMTNPLMVPSDSGAVTLRPLGVYSAQDLTFASFYVGTQAEFESARLPGMISSAFPPGWLLPRWRTPNSAWGMTVLLLMIGGFFLLALRRDIQRWLTGRKRAEAPSSLELVLAARGRPRQTRVRLPFYRQGLVRLARTRIGQLPYLRHLQTQAAGPARLEGEAEEVAKH